VPIKNTTILERLAGGIAGLTLGITLGYFTTGYMGDIASIPPTGDDRSVIFFFAIATAVFGFFFGRYLLAIAERFYDNL